MASGFCDAKQILLHDYLEKGETIASKYYHNLLARLNEIFRERYLGFRRKKLFFIKIMPCSQKPFGDCSIERIKVRVT